MSQYKISGSKLLSFLTEHDRLDLIPPNRDELKSIYEIILKKGNENIVMDIIDQYYGDSSFSIEEHIIMYQAINCNQINLLNRMIDLGFNLNQGCSWFAYEVNYLLSAIYNSSTDILRILIERGADIQHDISNVVGAASCTMRSNNAIYIVSLLDFHEISLNDTVRLLDSPYYDFGEYILKKTCYTVNEISEALKTKYYRNKHNFTVSKIERFEKCGLIIDYQEIMDNIKNTVYICKGLLERLFDKKIFPTHEQIIWLIENGPPDILSVFVKYNVDLSTICFKDDENIEWLADSLLSSGLTERSLIKLLLYYLDVRQRQNDE